MLTAMALRVAFALLLPRCDGGGAGLPLSEMAGTPAPTPAPPVAAPAPALADTPTARPTRLRRTEDAAPLPAGPSAPVATAPAPPASNSSQLAPLRPVANCYLAPLQAGRGHCRHLNTTQGPLFGINKYGQETTAKRECLARMRRLGGDSFVFATGWCQIWRCGSRDVLRGSAGPDLGPPQLDNSTSSAKRVAIKGHFGLYLGFCPDQRRNLHTGRTKLCPDQGNPDYRTSLHSGATEIGVLSRFWLISHEDGKVSLATYDGKFVSIRSKNLRLYADADAITATEKFGVVTYADGRMSFLNPWGEALSARPDGFLIADISPPGDWEKFTLTLVPPDPGNSTPAPAAPAGASVFSAHCRYQEGTGGQQGKEFRAPIFVKLMEWNYADIARECEEYLGPNGFDAVQISPVLEHVLGNQWWTKYQAVSYGLNSRSGSAEELAAMVAACRAAGVEVMVDLILNHMAGPCKEARNPRLAFKTPCTGWNGSLYGNRIREGARGWDAAGPELFHHYPGEPFNNCAVGPALNWRCGASVILRDCSCCRCDMYGMPDWNTSIPHVRAAAEKHVRELHDLGVTMLRIDAAIYEDVTTLSNLINNAPWDYVYQEWWGEYPVEDRTAFIGHYRDVSYRWRMAQPLAMQPPENLSNLLEVSSGVAGLKPELSLYPFAYHDGRTPTAVTEIPTYKNGLEYHQQQRYFLAAPFGIPVLIWGGFSWRELPDGPPGCEAGQEHCSPKAVFDEAGRPRCMPTPTESPLRPEQAQARDWVCEHRWAGVAGLVHFRKACRGLRRTQTWVQGSPGTGTGNLAFRLGDSCFLAVVRGYNRNRPLWGHMGDWSLANLTTGLPSGRYCDLGSLPTQKGWDRRRCPREVRLGAGGKVLSGVVPEGDILAIHSGTRLLEI